MTAPGYDPDEQALLTAWEEYWEGLTPEQRAAEDAALDADGFEGVERGDAR
jgi:hypothetical protein